MKAPNRVTDNFLWIRDPRMSERPDGSMLFMYCTGGEKGHLMKIHVFDSVPELAAFAAERVVDVIQQHERPVIGLATGSSPVPVYEAWGSLAKEREIGMAHVRCFALDEYVGIPVDHPESYHSVIARDATRVIGLNPELVRVPSGIGDVRANAEEYDAAIRDAGGIDLQILGLGRNAHLGFNEPGSPVDSRTREVELNPETIADNARFFDDISEVPTRAITQGMGTILDARELLIIVTGEAKAPSVAAALGGPVTENVPASLIREHPNVTWCLDRAAASML